VPTHMQTAITLCRYLPFSLNRLLKYSWTRTAPFCSSKKTMRQIPLDVITDILDHMRSDVPGGNYQCRNLYPCLTVSRAWLPYVEARLYEVVDVDSRDSRLPQIARALNATPERRDFVRRLVVHFDLIFNPIQPAFWSIPKMNFNRLASVLLHISMLATYTTLIIDMMQPHLEVATEVAFKGTIDNAQNCLLLITHCKRATSLSMSLYLVSSSRKPPKLVMPPLTQLEIDSSMFATKGTFSPELDLPTLHTLILNIQLHRPRLDLILASVPSLRNLILNVNTLTTPFSTLSMKDGESLPPGILHH
jgi:hypothetical protein